MLRKTRDFRRKTHAPAGDQEHRAWRDLGHHRDQRTLGRNTGNTFQQTYTGSSVQGVPGGGSVRRDDVPAVDYVALPVAHRTLYVAWLDPTTHAIVDAFVMNFATGVVFDYAPGSAQPESSGSVRILTRGANRMP